MGTVVQFLLHSNAAVGTARVGPAIWNWIRGFRIKDRMIRRLYLSAFDAMLFEFRSSPHHRLCMKLQDWPGHTPQTFIHCAFDWWTRICCFSMDKFCSGACIWYMCCMFALRVRKVCGCVGPVHILFSSRKHIVYENMVSEPQFK